MAKWIFTIEYLNLHKLSKPSIQLAVYVKYSTKCGPFDLKFVIYCKFDGEITKSVKILTTGETNKKVFTTCVNVLLLFIFSSLYLGILLN